MPKARSVDEYLATQPAAARGVLERVRSAIRRALPDAEETIAYQIPAYRLHERVVVYFAGWKQHFSLYPATERVVAACADELAGYQLSKGTIRFPLGEKVPVRLIARIAKLRAQEVLERAEKTKSAAAKPRRTRSAARADEGAAGVPARRSAARATSRSGGRAKLVSEGRARTRAGGRASKKRITRGGQRPTPGGARAG